MRRAALIDSKFVMNKEIEIHSASESLPKENRHVMILDDNDYHFAEWHKGFYIDGKWYSDRAEEFKDGIYTYTELYDVKYWAFFPEIE